MQFTFTYGTGNGNAGYYGNSVSIEITACGRCGLQHQVVAGTPQFTCGRCGAENFRQGLERCSRCAVHKEQADEQKLYLHEPTRKLYCGRCKGLFVDEARRRAIAKGATNDKAWTWIAIAFGTMPAELRPAIYRALARALHPDVQGGSEDGMRALNDARDRFVK